MQQHKFNIILRVKLLIIVECYGVTGQTGGTAGLEVKARLAPPWSGGPSSELDFLGHPMG
jgi:hypothetical protein